MTAEEEALLSKLSEIVRRVHELAAGETSTPNKPWLAQLEAAASEVRATPASDGGDEAFVARRHLKKRGNLSDLVATIDADVAGTTALLAVHAMPMTKDEMMKMLDADGDGKIDA
jgi:hypothetical protein